MKIEIWNMDGERVLNDILADCLTMREAGNLMHLYGQLRTQDIVLHAMPVKQISRHLIPAPVENGLAEEIHRAVMAEFGSRARHLCYGELYDFIKEKVKALYCINLKRRR